MPKPYKVTEPIQDPMTQVIDLSKLSATIRIDIQEYFKETGKEVPETLTVLEALHAYLFWNGILGYTSHIAQIVRGGSEG